VATERVKAGESGQAASGARPAAHPRARQSFARSSWPFPCEAAGGGARQPQVATPALINAPHAWREATLYPDPPGILRFAFRHPLALPHGLESRVAGLPPDRQLVWSAFRRGARRTGGARAIGGSVKSEADDWIARHIAVRRPMDAGLALGPARLRGLPIYDQGLHISALSWVMLPTLVPSSQRSCAKRHSRVRLKSMKPPLIVRPLTDEARGHLEGGLRAQQALTLRRCQMVLASAPPQPPVQMVTAVGCRLPTVRNALHAFASWGLACLTEPSSVPGGEYRLRNDSLIFFPIGCIVTSAMGEDVWRDVRTVCSSLAAEPGWPACARARC
jgi:hypothetical protein